MFDLISSVVAFFYDLYPSYGFAVLGLTVAVMVVVTPLTLKSTRSMLQMQRLQPELKAIQNRYKDDRQKMNEELMAFYQENGINPLGGCLPMLIQLPVFLVLFRVVRGITRHVSSVGVQSGWTAGRGSEATNTVAAIDSNALPFDPDHIPKDSQFYADLTRLDLPFADRPTTMDSLGMDLSRSAQSALSDGFVDALPYLAMIVVVLVSSLYQQRQIRGRNTGAQINPQQEMIMKVLPFMLPVFSFTMPAALVVYFVVSNLFRIGQQGYITHSLYKGDDSLGAQAARSREVARAAGDNDGAKGKGSGGRTTPKKGEPTPKRSEAAGSGKGGAKKRAAKPKRPAANSGRTGKAPSRQGRSGGGRTTDPGTSGSNRKRKR